MTQEEKQLLLKDLCVRLPYKTRVYLKQSGGIQKEFSNLELKPEFIYSIGYCIIKPYLRPMSSMTEEEEQYVLNTWGEDDFNNGTDLMYDNYMMLGYAPDFIDWLNAHHFDYRGLIPMGLAIEASEGMYKKED